MLPRGVTRSAVRMDVVPSKVGLGALIPGLTRWAKGFELVGDLCLSLSKIVTAARTVAEDPAVDGFGHHNPQLGQEDDLFYNALSIDRFMEGFF